MQPPRQQIRGADAVLAALRSGEPVRLVLVSRGADAAEVVAAALAAGAEVRHGTENTLWRLRADGAADVLALVGPPPTDDLPGLLGRGGATWLLDGLEYPGNTGFAIRQAEVSGADGVVVDAHLLGSGRKRALRSAMGAQWCFPVVWADAADAARAAHEAGVRVVCVEDVGTRAPWDVDLRERVLLVVGGESSGVSDAVLELADDVVRVPMAGFVPSYNVQAAMAAVTAERLRQLAAGTPDSR